MRARLNTLGDENRSSPDISRVHCAADKQFNNNAIKVLSLKDLLQLKPVGKISRIRHVRAALFLFILFLIIALIYMAENVNVNLPRIVLSSCLASSP